MNRPLVKQEATTFAVSVQITATPVNQQMGITAMIDSFIIAVPLGAANSVFIGFDAGVTVGTGLEILAGTSEAFIIDHDGRQLYELQYPLMDIRNAGICGKPALQENIPLVVWDMTQIYLVAIAITTVSVGVFKAVYV